MTTATAPAPEGWPAQLADRLDVLRGRPCTVAPLPGGLTNRNFAVSTPTGKYVVRVSSDETGALSIDRDHEHANSRIAAESGVGAPVVEYRPADSVLVVGFIDGVTLTDASFASPGVIARVAAACRRLHGGGRFVNDFDMFAVQRRYRTIVADGGYRLPDDYDEFTDHVERIRRALRPDDTSTVACNNDLLAGNFVDDGQQIWLIDYEYAGNNDPCFELGNIAFECHLDDEQFAALVTSYFGRPSPGLLARCRLQGIMSQYGWTLWASIQDANSTIDFDFWSWGMEKYDVAVRLFRGPAFDGWLDAAAAAGDPGRALT